MARQAFFRPVVIDTTNNRLTVTFGDFGPGPTLITIPSGTWSNWATVLEWIRWELVTGFSANAVVGFLSDGRVAFADQGGVSIRITWTTPALGYALGFDGPVGPASVVTGTYSVDRAWFPPYQFADQDRFALDQGDAFAGSKAKDGSLSGTSTGPDVFTRKFTYEHCPSELVFREGALAEGASEWHAERNFETFVKRSRTTMSPVAGMPSIKGFYYVQDFVGCGHLCFANDLPLTDAQPSLPESMGTGDVCFDLTTGTPDWYVFGFPGEAGWSARPSASVQRARQWYECGFEMSTAPAPSWDDADLPARIHPMLLNDQVPNAVTTISLACPAGNAVTVHWGDGTTEALVCDGLLKNLVHDYSATTGTGYYTISVSGDWRELTEWRSFSQAFLSGDLASWAEMVDLTTLSLHTNANMSGDIVNLAALVNLTILNMYSTSVSGNISSLAPLVNLTQFYAWAIPISGDIAVFAGMPNMARLQVHGTSVSGDIASLAGLVNLTILNMSITSVSGDIASLALLTLLATLYLYSTSCTYSTCVQPLAWRVADIRAYSCGWTTAMVDNMLIDHDAIALAGYASNLSIAGTNAGRTNPGAGENARASLVGKGKTVTVN
jgi:hypothetical protein